MPFVSLASTELRKGSPCLMGSQRRISWDTTQLLVAEYTQLREEIVKLVELQYQHVVLAVTTLGVVLSIGVGTERPVIVLVQPIVSLILGLSWQHHTLRIHRIAAYMKDNIERRTRRWPLAWEHYVADHPLAGGKFSFWALRAVFPVSSVLSLAVGLPGAHENLSSAALALAASLCTIALVAALIAWREHAP